MAIHISQSTSSNPQPATATGLRSKLSQALTAAKQRVAHARIDSLEAMYLAELQDLQSAEVQACAVAEAIWVDMHDESLSQLVSDYAAQMRSRRVWLDNLLEGFGQEARRHPDLAMRAMTRDAGRIDETCAESIRDAAWAAALQRIIHHMIACYGTIAAHAKALGRAEEAVLFAECADQEQAADAELSRLAKKTLNLRAMDSGRPESRAAGSD